MLRPLAAIGICVALLTGCVDPRMKAIIAEENEKARDLGVTMVGDITEVGNGGVMQVDGVGLVSGLQGTGHCPAGRWRNLLEQELLRTVGGKTGELSHLEPIVRVRKILDNPDNCLVIVTGYIPAGCRKRDRFDVHIKLPDGSKATSLAGGYLHLCTLRPYEAASNLSSNPKYQNANQLLQGHIMAHAQGRLIVGFGNNTDANELKHARVWQCGVSRLDRPYTFAIKQDQRTLQIANRVAERINFMYQEDAKSRARHADFSEQEKQLLLMGYTVHQLNGRQDADFAGPGDVAKASKESVIYVRVPSVYRLDHQRFVNVATRTPFRDADPDLVRYRQRLEKMLLDPRDTWQAALRLEALGRDSVPQLKAGLESEHPFVRFCSAEALAYLGNTLGVDALADLAEQHPILAKNATLALANLGEEICRNRLGELLNSREPALRCAAFHALTQLDENDSRLRGFHVKDTLWLHQITTAPTPMVYFSTSKRAQVVLFGKNIQLAPGTRVMIPKDFTVAHDSNANNFFVKRITKEGREEQRISSANLGEILSNLADLGATYPEIVDFLRRVNDYQNVNCPIVAWNTPDVPVETLVEAGRNMK